MKEDNRYSLGHFAVLLASDRYIAKAKEIHRLKPESDGERWNLVEAASYMSGLIDMACLYLGVINNDNAADHLSHIDKKIEGILAGTYGRDDGDNGSPTDIREP